MLLRTARTSPFGRKCWIAIHELGLAARIPVQLVALNALYGDANPVAADNPIGKVPVLQLDDGTALFDSPVICEYLDALGEGPRLHPGEGAARWRVARLAALGDGILEVARIRRHEGERPAENRMDSVVRHQARVHDNALDWLEMRHVAELGGPVDIGQITLACALDYFDLRLRDWDWRAGRPGLRAWFAAFRERPSMRATSPHAA